MAKLWHVIALALPAVCVAQWTPTKTPVSDDLLAVHALDQSVWVSGRNGTVLQSADAGTTWTKCVAPPGAEKADLRAVQAVDANTAVVMTSGKGERSRLFRMADGCKSWTAVFTNPDEAGSFDSLRRVTSRQMYLLGEPVGGKFAMYLSQDGGATWFIADDPGLDAVAGESAASSVLTAQGAFVYFGTGGGPTPYVHFTYAQCNPATPDAGCAIAWGRTAVGVANSTVRGVAVRTMTGMSGKATEELVAVGSAEGGARALALHASGSQTAWASATSLPAGPDAAVAFDGATQAWLAVGRDGTDISLDGGKTWSHAKGSPGADAGWAALSLPFAVGEKGAVGKLDRAALKP